ncbi:MAG: hypothetical protein OEV64_11020 [Desulfobulbaceae bacterium]|nr:hypothetical protein [Desulfobulbaceae bacterium]
MKKQDVEELSDRIFQKEEEITELRGQVGQLNSEIEKNQKKLDQLESNGKGQSNEARVLKETLHAQTAQQAALNRRISDNEQKIKNNEKRIQAIETSRKAYDDKLQMALEENKRLRNETRDKILEIEDSYKNKRTNADTNDDVEIDETSDSSNQQRDQ